MLVIEDLDVGVEDSGAGEEIDVGTEIRNVRERNKRERKKDSVNHVSEETRDHPNHVSAKMRNSSSAGYLPSRDARDVAPIL